MSKEKCIIFEVENHISKYVDSGVDWWIGEELVVLINVVL